MLMAIMFPLWLLEKERGGIKEDDGYCKMVEDQGAPKEVYLVIVLRWDDDISVKSMGVGKALDCIFVALALFIAATCNL
ncbi:hypothetical protein Lser_V15G42390 [Lactuca serriola]